MFDMNSKLMDRFFRKVDNVVWDLMTGKVGIKTKDGIVTIEGEGDDAQPVLNMFDQFGVAVPAFAQNTPVDSVQVGDLIMGAKDATGWVVEKKEKSFRILKADGTRTSFVPPKVAMIGFDSGVMVLRSLMNMLPGGSTALGGMQSMLMPMLMMGGDSIDLDKIMPMMLFSQVGNTGDPSATNNQMGNMMQMMMMMQMMGGNKKNGGSTGSFFDRS
jgi:hypothetical protein